MTGTQNTILITGAGGQYARLVIEGLLNRGFAPSLLILLTRNPQRLANYASKGLIVRKGCFDDPVSQLADAFAGASTLLLISTSRAGKRLPQHQTAVDAAVKAGVSHIVYTSILSVHMEEPTALVGREHKATEHMLRSSGLYWTALRDAQYAEAMTDVAGPPAFKTGVIKVNAGDGKIAFVSRDDCAAAAVAVLAEPTAHRNKSYDITGPELLSWADAANIMGEVVGKQISYEALTDEEQLAIFDAMGIPREPIDDYVVEGFPWNSLDMVSFTKATRLGEMAILSKDFEHLTGRKAMSFRQICEVRLKMPRSDEDKGILLEKGATEATAIPQSA